VIQESDLKLAAGFSAESLSEAKLMHMCSVYEVHRVCGKK